MVRLFVGLPLPVAVVDRLGALLGGVPGARWARPDQLHLTLRFIGEVDGGAFDDLRLELGRIRAAAFAMGLSGIDLLGDRHRARVLFVAVEPCPPLIELQARIEDAVCRLGLPPARRRFSPHVTLARLNGAPPPRIGDYLSHNALFRSGGFAIERFVLFSSHLSRSGSIYRTEASYPLVRAPAAALAR